jgi:hypothetical protein
VHVEQLHVGRVGDDRGLLSQLANHGLPPRLADLHEPAGKADLAVTGLDAAAHHDEPGPAVGAHR